MYCFPAEVCLVGWFTQVGFLKISIWLQHLFCSWKILHQWSWYQVKVSSWNVLKLFILMLVWSLSPLSQIFKARIFTEISLCYLVVGDFFIWLLTLYLNQFLAEISTLRLKQRSLDGRRREALNKVLDIKGRYRSQSESR